MEKKSVDTGEIVCGFGVRHTYEGLKNFDTDYIDREIIQVAKKVGDGEEDYLIIDKVKETRRPIRETLLSQFDESGIRAYLKPFEQTGQPLPDVVVNDAVDDFTKMPVDLAQAAQLGQNMKKIFAHIDPVLKGDCKTPEEFISQFTQAKFDEYIKSKTVSKTVESEDK